MILAGRDGQVKWDPTGVGGVSAVVLAAIKGFTLSMKVEKINVTCLGNQNRVYVPGLPDISGSLVGFWDSADMSLIHATQLTAPGYLELIPHISDGTPSPHKFTGHAYLDAEIDTDVEGAPAMSSEFVAADNWILPVEAAA